MQNPARPVIGVFDSGLGGLTVLGALAARYPAIDLVYAADTAHVPYGNKSPEAIRDRVLAMGAALIAQGCTTLVVACNTATVRAIAALREAVPAHIPIVGVEPGVKPAAQNTRSGQIAVLATAATAHSQRLAELIARYANGHIVHIIPCHGWATEVEALNLRAPSIIDETQTLLLPLIRQGVDQVVLGCTHYDFLAPTLNGLINGQAQLVGVADAVARQAGRVSGAETWAIEKVALGSIRLYATAKPERLNLAIPALGLAGVSRRISGLPGLLETS